MDGRKGDRSDISLCIDCAPCPRILHVAELTCLCVPFDAACRNMCMQVGLLTKRLLGEVDHMRLAQSHMNRQISSVSVQQLSFRHLEVGCNCFRHRVCPHEQCVPRGSVPCLAPLLCLLLALVPLLLLMLHLLFHLQEQSMSMTANGRSHELKTKQLTSRCCK